MIVPILGGPHISVANHAPARRVFKQVGFDGLLAGGKVIDSSKCRDPGSVDNSGFLRPGLLMGKVTASKKYANSVIGASTGALTNSGTTLASSAAIVAELIRRLGNATTAFSLTGPPVASGVVRTLTVTPSAMNTTTGDITITNPSVNSVQTLNFANSPAGTFRLRITDSSGVRQSTARITYSATIATLLANLQAATDAVLATNAIVWSGTLVTAVAGTFSGTGYAALPQQEITVDTDALTAGTISVAQTTAGVDGRFVSGSLIQPSDGSQTPLTVLPDGFNWNLIDMVTGLAVDIPFSQFPIAGIVESAQLLPWPADSSLQAWVVASLKAAGQFVFDSSY